MKNYYFCNILYIYMPIQVMNRIVNLLRRQGHSVAMLPLFLTLSLAVLCGCTSGSRRELNHLLVELGNDGVIDHGDWVTISDYLTSQRKYFSDFFKDDKIDTEEVKDYISNYFEHRRPPRKISFIGIGDKEFLTVNFYLERSGSMEPYDSRSGDGSFKAAIVQMLNNLPGSADDNRIYVVNSTINAYPRGFAKFLADNDIFSSTRGIGDPSYTDFGAIFRKILQQTGPNDLSILVTDMIYSTRSMEGVNPQKVFAEAEGMTHAVFKSQVKDKSILIIKMHGSYDGPYYTYDSPVKGQPYHGSRPYYILVVGSNDNMARLTKDNSYAAFSDFQRLKGYVNMYLFEAGDVYEPYYSLLLSHPDIKGRFEPERGQGTTIHDITDVKPDRDSGDIRLVLAVDLSKMLIDDKYLLDKNNYVVESDDGVELEDIRPLTRTDVTPAEKKYAGTATHLFVLHAKQIKHSQDVDIKLVNRLPLWVEASSSDDDTRMGRADFSWTTFGLKYLLQGIYDSYKKDADGEPTYFELDLKFKN